MGQIQKIGSLKTNVRTENGTTHVQYHSTDVVSFNDRVIILRTGGWLTNTTKTRMNQTSNQFDLGFRVYQKNYDWYVDFRGTSMPFKEDMTLER